MPTEQIEKITFKKLIMTIGNLPSSYVESLSYYECMLWLCNYLENTVVPAVNNNGEAVEELQGLYVELKEYVDTYFENLDVQEEINNKLDEMTEDGTLTNIIKNYVDPIYQAYENSINATVSAQNTEISNFKNSVNSQISSINSTVESVASSSPKGVYATVSALQTADPSHDSIYVVTADGKWYYYDTGTSSWTAGGTYQSTGIADDSIFYNMLNSKLRSNIVPATMVTGELNIDSNYYSGSVGSTPTLNSSADFCCGYITVNPGDIVYSDMFFAGSYGAVYTMFMLDENDLIVQRLDRSSFYDTNTKTPKEFIYRVPADVKKICFNSKYGNASTNPTKWYPYIITSYNYDDNRLTNQLSQKTSVLASSTISNKIYSLNYWNKDQTGYDTLVYPVNSGDKMNLIISLYPNEYAVAGIFVNADLKPVGFINERNNTEAFVDKNIDFIVPAESRYLYVSNNRTYGSTLYKYVFNDTVTIKKMTVSYVDGVLTMLNNLNNNSITMKNSPSGNGLFEINGYTVNNTSKAFETDMIPAPYIVKAVNNANGDRDFEGFTGGQHQFNNQESGSTPTASQYSLQILVDNRDISGETDISLQADEVKIIEVNNVQATNTCLAAGGGRNVLQERIVYTYNGRELDVVNTITPLEDIDLRRYYGIQTALFNNNEYSVYADKLYDVDSVENCPSKPSAIYGGNLIKAELFNEGLGDYHLNNTDMKATISNYKSYYVPVRWQNTTNIIPSGSKQYIHGRYTFDYIQK